MHTAAETEKPLSVSKYISSICHVRDADLSFTETVVNDTLTLLIGIAPTEGRIAIYGAIRRTACDAPVHLTVVRDMTSVETIRLTPHTGTPAAQDMAQADDLVFLHGESICFVQDGAKKSGQIHLVCQDKVVLRSAVDFVAPQNGRLEQVQSGRISGWAVDLLAAPGTIEIELVINGVVYLTQRAAVPRPDVAEIYPSHLASGFEFNVGLDEMPFEKMQIRTRIKGTTHDIKARRSTYERPKEARARIPVHQRNVPRKPVFVIVPIYNAPTELRECIDTLLLHTELGAGKHRVILSDDASPDPEVARVLDAYDGHDGLVILRNTQNRGYTGNVNHGIQTARDLDPDADVVLLNSDTRVTPRWLDLLQLRALQSPSIGTVSAMSDNAGAFSVPTRNSANPVPPWMTEDDHARLVTHISSLHDLRVPTTSGFCMYIKQGVFADIGLFDEENFPRGYGEENDFCMRALYKGWEHAIADNVIIYHERSASFLGAKTALMDRAGDLIPKMYPEYPLAVNQGFVQSGDINQTRFNITYSRLRHDRLPRPRVMFVIGVESGGTPQTNMDLMSSIQTEYEPYLVLCSTGFLRVFRIVGTEQILLETIALRHRVMPIAHDSDSYRHEIADILQRYGFELVHIRHIGRHGLSLVRTARDLNIPVLFSLHDFYTVCPNVKLLDAENRYCGGTCTKGGKDCNVELWAKKFTPKLKDKWVHNWRKLFQDILPMCQGLITTSPYARDLIQSTFDLTDVPFDVIPHARDFEAFNQLAAPMAKGEPLRVFVPGHIVPAKGLDLIKAIKALDVNEQIEFHFAGLSPLDLSQYGVYHGSYKREEFGQLVEKINPHLGAVLSIWPETYSHTLTELWSCGLPVITSNYGATGERVGQHGGGWACDDLSPEGVLAFLLTLAADTAEIANKRDEVLSWQSGYGRDYSLPIMSERYKQLYRRALRKPSDQTTEVMAVQLGGDTNGFMPTDHLRTVLEPEYASVHISVWPVTTLRLFNTLETPEILVIRYHGETNQPTSMIADLENLFASETPPKLVVDVAADAFIDTQNADFMLNRPILAWVLSKADHIIGPAEYTSERTLPDPVDLTVMVPTEADHTLLPNHPAPDLAHLLPAQTLDYSARIAARLDTEILAGASEHLYLHNAHLAAANFTLIDWDAMLSRPRVPNLVSLVIPTFNRVGLTEKFLRSIIDLTQGTTEFEIIVIDNGSKPEARVQIEALAALDPRIKVVCAMVPLMFSVGCNYGASFAQGEYILFLNNDMEVIEANWLDALMAPLTEADDIGIVGGRLLFGDHTVQHAGLAFSKASDLAYHLYSGETADVKHVMKQREMQAVTGACMAMRATDWAKLRGFNPLFVNGCEDVDLCLRMVQVLQRKVMYVPASLLLHHEGKSPGRGRNVLQNRFVFCQLWGGKPHVDDIAHYIDDGFNTVSHTTNDAWLAQRYRTVSVALE